MIRVRWKATSFVMRQYCTYYVFTYLIGSSLSGLFRVNWNLEMLVFKERGKPEYPEKNLSEQGREPTTNNKLAMCFPAHKNVLIFTQRMHKPTERPFM